MSGGHFDNFQYHINDIACEIDKIIRDNNVKNDWGYSYDFSEETLKLLREGLNIMKLAFIYAHRIDWLICADDGEETFKQRLEEELGRNSSNDKTP